MDETPAGTGEHPVTPSRNVHGVRRVFIGPNGIRAGWSVLIFIAIFLSLAASGGYLLTRVVHADLNAPLSPKSGLLAEGFQLALVVIATWLMCLIERKPVLSYGYQGSRRATRFVSGLGWGFVAISVLVGALWKTHLLVLDGVSLGGAAAMRYAVEWGLVFLCAALFEESLLRGYLQFTLTRGIGFWWGAVLLSLLFGTMHHSNPGESPVGLVSAGAVGLVLCVSLWYTGSLWWAVGFHLAWDWGETFFYGTGDSGMVAQGHLLSEHPLGKLLWSGGATGPEGSLLVLPLLLVVAVLMWLWWRRRAVSPFAGAGWNRLPPPNR